MIISHYPAHRDFINTSLPNNINNGNSSTRHSSRLHLTEVKSTRQALYLTLAHLYTCLPVYRTPDPRTGESLAELLQ